MKKWTQNRKDAMCTQNWLRYPLAYLWLFPSFGILRIYIWLCNTISRCMTEKKNSNYNNKRKREWLIQFSMPITKSQLETINIFHKLCFPNSVAFLTPKQIFFTGKKRWQHHSFSGKSFSNQNLWPILIRLKTNKNRNKVIDIT